MFFLSRFAPSTISIFINPSSSQPIQHTNKATTTQLNTHLSTKNPKESIHPNVPRPQTPPPRRKTSKKALRQIQIQSLHPICLARKPLLPSRPALLHQPSQQRRDNANLNPNQPPLHPPGKPGPGLKNGQNKNIPRIPPPPPPIRPRPRRDRPLRTGHQARRRGVRFAVGVCGSRWVFGVGYDVLVSGA